MLGPPALPLYLSLDSTDDSSSFRPTDWVVSQFSAVVGCASSRTSDTARTATEQVLISNAIDRSLGNVSFDQLNGRKVFIDDKYLDSVDKGYLIGSIRHKALASGATIAKDADSADIVLRFEAVCRHGLRRQLHWHSQIERSRHADLATRYQVYFTQYSARDRQDRSCCLRTQIRSAVGLGGQTTALTEHDDVYFLGMVRSEKARSGKNVRTQLATRRLPDP